MPASDVTTLNANPNAQVVYADPETEKMLLECGFVKASGAPYYNYMGTAVDVIATREPVENFVKHLTDWAEKDRNALLCQLNSCPGQKEGGA